MKIKENIFLFTAHIHAKSIRMGGGMSRETLEALLNDAIRERDITYRKVLNLETGLFRYEFTDERTGALLVVNDVPRGMKPARVLRIQLVSIAYRINLFVGNGVLRGDLNDDIELAEMEWRHD